MKTKTTCSLLGCLIAGGLLAQQKKTDKPNIVFILLDDFGWEDAGFMGSKYYSTPNMDKLAASGMVFTNAYTNGPNSAPTRASLMTGMYTPRHGILTVNKSDRGNINKQKLIPAVNKTILDTSFITVAEVLKKNGYRTGSIGKWHLGVDPENGPCSQGFDVNVAGNHAGMPDSYFSPYTNSNLPDGPKGEYLTDRLTGEAINFIKQNKENPFFLYMPYYAVHVPYQAKDSLVQEYQKRHPEFAEHAEYAAMIQSADEGVGAIVDEIRKNNLLDNTIIILYSDNGGIYKTLMPSLRGCKGQLYEGGIRVPLVVSWKGKIQPASTCNEVVIGMDIYSTIAEITAAKVNHAIDGISIVPLLMQNGSLNRTAVYWHFPVYLPSSAEYVSKGIYLRATPCAAIRKGDYKLIKFYEDNHLELYNLKSDLKESKNLTDQMPGKAKELEDDLFNWQKKMNITLPTTLNPLYKE